MIRGKAAWFGGTKIFCIASIAYPQEIFKTYPKSYPSYFHSYPRNGKTTVSNKLQITLTFNGSTLRLRFERINLNGKLHQLERLNVNAAVFGMAKGGHHDINFYLA